MSGLLNAHVVRIDGTSTLVSNLKQALRPRLPMTRKPYLNKGEDIEMKSLFVKNMMQTFMKMM